jgi:diguanylate cyclase (GGDEF)-like protein
MGKFHKSLKWKLILGCMTALVVVITVIHLAVYVTTRNAIERQFIMSVRTIAVAVAHNLEENIEEYESFTKKFLDKTEPVDHEYFQDPYYQKQQAFFAILKSNGNVKYISTEHRVDEKSTVYVLDSEPAEDKKNHSAPGEFEYNGIPQRETVFSTQSPAGFNIFKDERWGDLIEAYAPIFNRNGKMLGLTSVSIDASHLHHKLNRIQTVLFLTYAIILGMTLLVLTRYSNAILEPMLKDKLTGAYRKRYFEELIQDEITTAIKDRKGLALLMLDLDHFKKINDTYGHGFGDIVLASTSETIKNILRQKDYFIRFGGEEFIALITNVNEKRAWEIAERIRRTVETSEIFNEEKNITITMTISIGVANLGGALISVHEFIDRADKALYVAKENRNCSSVFNAAAMDKEHAWSSTVLPPQ